MQAMPNDAAAAPPLRHAAQRRYLTVLFSDVCGSSEHADCMDPEDYAEALEQFRSLARSVVEQHGGSIARLQGDGLLALFGHAETSENDARQAAEAALALHAAVAQVRVGQGADAQPMRLHSGIHAGLVLLLEGGIELGRYDVVGEVPNTAARLSSMAGAGEVFVSSESLGPTGQFFETRTLGQLPIRGRRAPLHVLQLCGRHAAGRRIDAAARRGTVGLIGRRVALNVLVDLAERHRAADACIVLLRGEPGVGKTRLADEFLNGLSSERYAVLHGYSEQGLGAEPLQPIVQILRSALGWKAGASRNAGACAMAQALAELGQAATPHLEAFAKTLSGDAGVGRPTAMAIAALKELLHLHARHRTVVVMLDDWQWADDLTRQTVQSLRAQRAPVLFVVASRPVADQDPALQGAEVIELQPLSGQDAIDTVSAWLPDANAFVVQEICSRSGGSPLFIEELCHAAAAGRGAPALAPGDGEVWLHTLVASRLEGLPPALAECLSMASVVGSSFAPWLLQQALARDDVDALCSALVELDFLLPPDATGIARFKHVLTRDAVYATVPLEHRRSLHAQLARLLLSQAPTGKAAEHLESLSYHFNAAGHWREAARFAEAAGDKALSAMALDRARAQYTVALKALDAQPSLSPEQALLWCSVAQRLGQTCVFDALGVDQSLPLLERAAMLAERTGDAQAKARAHYWLGYVFYGKGQPRRAVDHCRAACTHAQASGDTKLLVQVQATLGQSLASAGRYDEALPLLRGAYEDKRRNSRPGSGTAIGSSYTLARTAYTLGDIGRFDEAHACFDGAFDLLAETQHAVRASVLELQCAVYLWQGLWDDARAAGLRGAEVALQCRSRFNTEMGRALAACAVWAATADPEALQTLRTATQWIEAQGGAVSTSLNYGWLVEACFAAGQPEQARRHAAQLLLRARAEDQQGLAQGLRALALEAARQADPVRAERWLSQADQAGERRGSARERAMNLLAHARVARAFAHVNLAQAQASAAADAFGTLGMAVHAEQARELMDRAP